MLWSHRYLVTRLPILSLRPKVATRNKKRQHETRKDKQATRAQIAPPTNQHRSRKETTGRKKRKVPIPCLLWPRRSLPYGRATSPGANLRVKMLIPDKILSPPLPTDTGAWHRFDHASDHIGDHSSLFCSSHGANMSKPKFKQDCHVLS